MTMVKVRNVWKGRPLVVDRQTVPFGGTLSVSAEQAESLVASGKWERVETRGGRRTKKEKEAAAGGQEQPE